MKVVARVTKFHGHIAMPTIMTMYAPRRMLIYWGQMVVISMPAGTEFSTMHSAIWLASSPMPAKNVPARDAGVMAVWACRSNRNGFQNTCPYIRVDAEAMRIPQSAVTQIVTGAVMACPKRAAFGVLAYLVQSFTHEIYADREGERAYHSGQGIHSRMHS
jgi:hypothetical protein